MYSSIKQDFVIVKVINVLWKVDDYFRWRIFLCEIDIILYTYTVIYYVIINSK